MEWKTFVFIVDVCLRVCVMVEGCCTREMEQKLSSELMVRIDMSNLDRGFSSKMIGLIN